MDNRNEVQQFLTAQRARITPEKAGLTVFGGERRVPGLCREEVAQLAGVSTAYYTRMERGDLARVSESVLFALARGASVQRCRDQPPVRPGPDRHATPPGAPDEARTAGVAAHRAIAHHDA
jgi:helix-turn-helix protein